MLSSVVPVEVGGTPSHLDDHAGAGGPVRRQQDVVLARADATRRERIVTLMGGDRSRAPCAKRIEPCPEGVSPNPSFGNFARLAWIDILREPHAVLAALRPAYTRVVHGRGA